jgi:hypothetical protein
MRIIIKNDELRGDKERRVEAYFVYDEALKDADNEANRIF